MTIKELLLGDVQIQVEHISIYRKIYKYDDAPNQPEEEFKHKMELIYDSNIPFGNIFNPAVYDMKIVNINVLNNTMEIYT